MDSGGQKPGLEPQGTKSPAPSGSGLVSFTLDKPTIKLPSMGTASPNTLLTAKGVENAKKRLRAFSIQKKTPITPVPVVKPISTGSGTTVLIGKLTSVKVTPKPDDPIGELKKPPKPPKPGVIRKSLQQDYMVQQKKTQSEIEDMKRKMELVDLGIPLGLICPTSTSDKAMPTKAMPPIKSFLDPAKVDELILEAKKAKAAGKPFKFDYRKLLPGYDNPFQRKRDESGGYEEDKKITDHNRRGKSKDRRKSDKFDKRYSFKREGGSDKIRAGKDSEKSKEREEREETESIKDSKEANVNLSDYLVCDSWSLDNDDKNSTSSPKVEDKIKQIKDIPMPKEPFLDPMTQLKMSLKKTEPSQQQPKVEKLHPVMDTFEYEIDPNEDVLDIFDKESSLDKYAKPTVKKDNLYDSPVEIKLCDDQSISKDGSTEGMNDDSFLQSVINEIKQEDISDDESHDKGLVEYDISPLKDDEDIRGSVTPELKNLCVSRGKDYSDNYKSIESGYKSTESRYKPTESGYKSTKSGYKSTESGYKSTESGHKSTESGYKSTESGYKSTESGYKSSESGYKSMESNYKSTESGYKSTESYKSSISDDSGRSFRMSIEKELEELDENLAKSTVDSLETWSFVLKICQPLLFRHDKNKCYKETRATPKLWYTENPKVCNCVKDRSVVYEELEMCKMNLVDRVYGFDQISDTAPPSTRTWYPRSTLCLSENTTLQLSTEDDWATEEGQVEVKKTKERRSMTPQRNEEIYLDREYQRFMQAVLTDVSDKKLDTSRSTTPVTQDTRKKKSETEDKKRSKKIKLSSEGWSQESDLEEDDRSKKLKADKEKEKVRKRKHSTSVSESEDQSKKKKALKKKDDNKSKSKSSKRRRLSRKYLKKLKEKKKKKLIKLEMEEDSGNDDEDKVKKKKDKKYKKKKLQQLKRKSQKKKKGKSKSSSSSDSSSTSDSSSETDSEEEQRKKKKNKEFKKKKRKQSSSESTQSEELFDVNILNNIKTEKMTDDEKQGISPRKKPREIIDVKELQEDFVGKNIHIKKEAEEQKVAEEVKVCDFEGSTDMQSSESPDDNKIEETEFKEPQDPDRNTPQLGSTPDEYNLSQSSQDSQLSKEHPVYEKDESHLRPSSQNSNYSFNDVITASQNSYQKDVEDDKFVENYEQGNYEMYEQLAMAYQSDVASQVASPPSAAVEQRIETVVRTRSRGEIKCDWRRPSDPPAHPAAHLAAPPHRPSRWGLKPGDVNIVLTGGTPERVYQIQSIANRTDNCNIGYDEAYMDTYGALDKLQYGDCFADTNADADADVEQHVSANIEQHITSSLDARISQALQNTVLGEVAKEAEDVESEKDVPEKGILVTNTGVARVVKRVSFADGFAPGQDSDTERPPTAKKRRIRRVGCAWPCPATHADHVPLWDALPPPPPPPGSPPPPAAPPAPPLHLLRPQRPTRAPLLPPPPHHVAHKFDPNASLPGFMPPEPPPGLISLGSVI